MNEAETRAEHIDPALAAAGWGVVEGSRIRREYQITPGRIERHGCPSAPDCDQDHANENIERVVTNSNHREVIFRNQIVQVKVVKNS